MSAYNEWEKAVKHNVKVWDKRLETNLPTEIDDCVLGTVLNLDAKSAGLYIVVRDQLIFSRGVTKNTGSLATIVVAYVYGQFTEKEIVVEELIGFLPGSTTFDSVSKIVKLIRECRKARNQ